MSVRSVFPRRAVVQLPVSHAGGPHFASFTVGRPCACVRACVRARAQAWRNTLRVRACAAEALPRRTRRQCKEVGDRASGPLSGPKVALCRGVGNVLLRPSVHCPSAGVPASLGGRTRFHGGLTISQARATHAEDNW